MTEKPKFQVKAYEPEGISGPIVFSFLSQQESGSAGALKRVPQFIVAVRAGSEGAEFDWSGSPNDPGASREEFQAEIVTRMDEKSVWIRRVNELVTSVENWARELGWSTKRVEKKLEDARVGAHRVPALLMQAETCRIILEPVGRSSPGSEGVVDLYLMPAYDDIASIYYYGGRWNLHYMFSDSNPVLTTRESEALPLSKETLEKVLAEMVQDAV